MRRTIDAAGRLVVPKRLRERLGLRRSTELDVVDDRLEISVPSRVHVEEGPHGLRIVAVRTGEHLTSATVRDLTEGIRR